MRISISARIVRMIIEHKRNKIEKEVEKMLTHKGGHRVDKGTYWNVRNGHRVDVTEEYILPGNESTHYIKMSAGAMLLSGPFIGLAYVVFLPFIGIAMVATVLGREIMAGAISLVGKSISVGWRPQSAYLSGKKKEKAKDKANKK
jgi:hypothetical protein